MTRSIGIIMNGVTGRMGLNQHLRRSIHAIIQQGGVRTSDATTLTKTRLLLLTRPELKQLMRTRPLVAEAAITFLAKKLRATSQQLAEIALSSVEARLARFLLDRASLISPPDAQPTAVLSLGMKQAELGLLIGASRQATSKALGKLARSGAVKWLGSSTERLECNTRLLETFIERA